jgi:hypothetical protein
MRAITVRQPWAWAIVHGGKDVENRTRNIAGAYRGPVAIHAGKTLDEGAVDSLAFRQAWHEQYMPQTIRDGFTEPVLEESYDEEASWLQRGVLLGVVDLIDSHWSGGDYAFDESGWTPCLHHHCYSQGWAMAGHQHLVLSNPRPLVEPIPYKGALGLWTLPDEVLA